MAEINVSARRNRLVANTKAAAGVDSVGTMNHVLQDVGRRLEYDNEKEKTRIG